VERSPPKMSGSAPELEVSVFGTFRIRKQGEEVSMGKALQLTLAILALEGEKGLATTRLLDLLWQSGKEANLRPRLNQRVLDVRNRVGINDCIQCENGRHRLSTELVSTDVARVERLLAEKKLGEAAKIIANRLLRDADLSATPEAEAWIRQRQLEFETRLKDAAEYVWQAAVRAGDWHVAADAAGALFRLNPSDEGNLRKLGDALARSEKSPLEPQPDSPRSGAQLDRSRERLGHPDPPLSPRLLEVKEEAKGRDRAIFATAVTELRHPPFVGREVDLHRLRDLLDSDQPLPPKMVLLRGERGVGKTRLCQELLSRLSAEGLAVLPMYCRGQSVAFAPLIAACDYPWVGEAISDLPEPAQAALASMWQVPPPLTSSATEDPTPSWTLVPHNLCSAFAMLLEAISERESLILFVDDLETGDLATLGVILQLVATWNRPRFRILATVANPGPAVAQLRRLGSSMDTQFQLAELELPPMETEAILRLSALAWRNANHRLLRGEGSLPPEYQSVAPLAAGNPSLALSMLESLLEPPILIEGQQQPSGDEILRTVVYDRLAGSDAATERLAQTLACLGQPTSLSALSAHLEVSVDEAGAAAGRLVESGVGAWIRGRLGLSSEMVQSVLYRSLQDETRVAIHSKLARSLQNTQDPGQAFEVATHFARAGQPVDARRWALRASEESKKAGILNEQARALELVLGLREEWTEDDLEPALDLARVKGAEADFSESARWYQLAKELALLKGDLSSEFEARFGLLFTEVADASEVTHDQFQRVRTLQDELHVAGLWGLLPDALELELRMLARMGRYDELRFAAKRLSAVPRSPSEPVARRISTLASIGTLFAPLARHERHSHLVLSAALEGGDQGLALQAMNWQLILGIRAGTLNSEAGIELRRQAQALAAESGDPFTRIKVHANLGVWYMDAGELGAAELSFQRAHTISAGCAVREGRANLMSNLGTLKLEQHEYEAALEIFSTVLEMIPLHEHHPARIYAIAGQTLALASAGRRKEAESTADHLEDLPRPLPFDSSIVARARSKILLAKNDRDGAAELLRSEAVLLADHFRLGWARLGIEQLRLSSDSHPSLETVRTFVRTNNLKSLESRLQAILSLK